MSLQFGVSLNFIKFSRKSTIVGFIFGDLPVYYI